MTLDKEHLLILKGIFVSGNYFSVCPDGLLTVASKRSTPRGSSQSLNIFMVNSGLFHRLHSSGFASFEYLLSS